MLPRSQPAESDGHAARHPAAAAAAPAKSPRFSRVPISRCKSGRAGVLMTSNDAGGDPWRPAMARDVRRCVLTTDGSAGVILLAGPHIGWERYWPGTRAGWPH